MNHQEKCYLQHRTRTAAQRAKRLWPGTVGEYLAKECSALEPFTWLTGELRLVEAILEYPEPGA